MNRVIQPKVKVKSQSHVIISPSYLTLGEPNTNHFPYNHENAIVHYIGQGEVRHRKYNRLKLGGGHVYDCSSD
jgi:hypothetical protein